MSSYKVGIWFLDTWELIIDNLGMNNFLQTFWRTVVGSFLINFSPSDIFPTIFREIFEKDFQVAFGCCIGITGLLNRQSAVY